MTTDQDPSALAPCPFCGSKHVRASRYGEVLCMEGDCDARQDSVDAWNRRVPDPAVLALTEERDALRALLLEAREALVPDNGSIGDRERFEVGQRIDAALRGKEGT